LPPLSETVDADIAELICRATGLRSKAKAEICHSILMLDLAAKHGRQIAERVCDSAVKENFNTDITTIEQLLQVARNMALRL
jgi:hypothetical protein